MCQCVDQVDVTSVSLRPDLLLQISYLIGFPVSLQRKAVSAGLVLVVDLSEPCLLYTSDAADE